MTTTTPLLAYCVQEQDELTGGFVFARSSAEARRVGSQQFGSGDFAWGRARRAQWADKYAPGPVPKLAMIDHGWWFECHGCQIKICDDMRDEETDDPLDLKPVEYGSAIYCSEACRDDWLEERRQRRFEEAVAIAELSALLAERLPGIEIVARDGHLVPHAYVVRQADGSWAPQQCSVGFTFPGCKVGLASYRYDKIGEEPRVSVCNGDLDAWNEWRAAQIPANAA